MAARPVTIKGVELLEKYDKLPVSLQSVLFYVAGENRAMTFSLISLI